MCRHLPRCRHFYRCRHFFQVLTHASTSQFATKKVHMISMTDVGTFTCWHVPRCRHLFRCWHMSVHISIQIKKSIWLVWRMSARVGTLTCRHVPRCRHLFRCWHMSVHISIQIKKSKWLVSGMSAPSQVSALFQVLTHASTSQFANKKSPYD